MDEQPDYPPKPPKAYEQADDVQPRKKETVPPPVPNRVALFSAVKSSPARCVLVALGLVVLGNWWLYGVVPGIALGLFALASAGAVLVCYLSALARKEIRGLLVLLAISALWTGVEVGFSQVVVLVLTLFAFSGAVAFPAGVPLLARMAEGLASAFRFFPSVLSLLQNLFQMELKTDKTRQGRSFVSWFRVALPAIGIGGFFLVLMLMGNSVLSKLSGEWFDKFLKLFENFEAPSPSQVFVWGVLAAWAALLLKPESGRWTTRVWGRPFPRWGEEASESMRRMQSVLVLLVVNAVFLLNNTVDVVHMWLKMELPQGVHYAQYLHQGVGALTLAVVIAALVMSVLFQQRGQVANSVWARRLAYLWIAQCLVLVAGVLGRLYLYIDAFWLTPKRIYVGFFLLLVVAGYVMLARFVSGKKSFGWLMRGNLFAVFVLFFVEQFLPVEAWVARYNFSQWQEYPSRPVEYKTYEQLGDDAYWLALQIGASEENSTAVTQARTYLNYKLHRLERRWKPQWQEYEYRWVKNREWLQEQADNYDWLDGRLESFDNEPMPLGHGTYRGRP